MPVPFVLPAERGAASWVLVKRPCRSLSKSPSSSPRSGVLRRGRMICGLREACRRNWGGVTSRESISETVPVWNRIICLSSGFPRSRE